MLAYFVIGTLLFATLVIIAVWSDDAYWSIPIAFLWLLVVFTPAGLHTETVKKVTLSKNQYQFTEEDGLGRYLIIKSQEEEEIIPIRTKATLNRINSGSYKVVVHKRLNVFGTASDSKDYYILPNGK